MNDVTEEEREEQLDIVLRLNKQTKRGKLSWRRGQIQRTGTSRDVYVADLDTYRIIVEEAPAGQGIGSLLERQASYRLRIRHRHAEADDEDRIVIPPMPAIDDLVSTIQRVNDEPDRSKGNLDELRSFKKHLDEEL
jgi:hypothetical protein